MRVAAGILVLVAMTGCDHLLDLPDIKPHPATPTPQYIGFAVGHGGRIPSLMFSADVPDASDVLMIVSVMLSASGTTMPQVTSITYGGVPLTLLDAIIGVPSSPATRTEQWKLVAPPVGSADVVIMLSEVPDTIHGSAMIFIGVDQVTPIRDVKHLSGDGASSQVAVDSDVNDLVESCVGQGGNIVGAGGDQLTVFLDDATSMWTLDNAAGSTAAGAAPSVTMSWTFSGVDHYQQIAASLQPAM